MKHGEPKKICQPHNKNVFEPQKDDAFYFLLQNKRDDVPHQTATVFTDKPPPKSFGSGCCESRRAPWRMKWRIERRSGFPKTGRKKPSGLVPRYSSSYMDVSENSGTPKSSILVGFSIINHPFWGTPIFGNIHIPESSNCVKCVPKNRQKTSYQFNGILRTKRKLQVFPLLSSVWGVDPIYILSL